MRARSASWPPSPSAAPRCRRRGVRQRRQQTASSDELSGGSRRPACAATINGAGSTFAAPVYQQWAATSRAGHHRELPGASARAPASRSSQPAPSTSPAPTRRSRRRRDRGRSTKGEPRADPDRASARSPCPTTSTASQGSEARRQDGRRHLPRQGQEVERPGDRAAEPGRQAARDANITVVHRSDESGTTKGFTDVPRRLQPGVEEQGRRRQGRQVADGHRRARATTASPRRSSRPRARIGYVEQAYALQNNFTFADIKNKSGKFIAPTLESTSAAGDGIEVPTDLRHQHDRRARRRQAYPIASQTFIDHLQGPVQGAASTRPRPRR